MTSTDRRPPTSLDRRRKPLWRSIVAAFDLSDAEYRILEDALRLLQRADQAAAVVDAEGVTVSDRYGTPKTHPAVDVEVRCRTSAARLLGQLNVKVPEKAAPLQRAGRPGPRPGWRG
jgi:hypothetical protein